MVVRSLFFEATAFPAGVDDDKASGAIGGFQRARRKATLADGGGLLVAGDAADGQLCIKQPCITDAELGSAVHDLWQAGPRHIKQRQQIIIPVIFMYVVEAGAAGIGGVGDMHPATGQTPDEEAVDGAETQLAGGGAVARALNPVKDPGKFGGGEIGVEKQSGLFRDHVLLAGILHHRADIGGAPVLPDDGIVDGLAGGAVPDDGGLALVGDADGGRHAAARSGLGNHGCCHIDGGLPNVFRVMLDPAIRWEMLRKLGRLLRQDCARSSSNKMARELVVP